MGKYREDPMGFGKRGSYRNGSGGAERTPSTGMRTPVGRPGLFKGRTNQADPRFSLRSLHLSLRARSTKSAPLDPNRKPIQWRIIWDVFKNILPAAGLILAVLGSIFAGITTPTETSGIGALGAIILTIINRRFSWFVLKEVTIACFNTSAYIYGILVGATAFALVLRSVGGDGMLIIAY